MWDELVHADVGPTETHDARDARLLVQKPAREMQQASEVPAVAGDERPAVPLVQPRQPRRRVNQYRRVSSAVVGFREQAVHETEQIPAIRRQWRIVVWQTGRGFVKNGKPILVLREQREVRPQPYVTPVLTEYVGGERVERAQAGAVRPVAEKLLHPLAHPGGGLVRERQRQHRRFVAFFENPRDPHGEHARLAGTRPGQHQQRTAAPRRGPALVRVESVKSNLHHAVGTPIPIPIANAPSPERDGMADNIPETLLRVNRSSSIYAKPSPLRARPCTAPNRFPPSGP